MDRGRRTVSFDLCAVASTACVVARRIWLILTCSYSVPLYNGFDRKKICEAFDMSMVLGRVRVRMDSCACRARHVAERLMCRHMRSAARLRDRRPAAGSWCCCLHRPAARWCCCLHRSQKPSPLRRPRRRARRRRCEQALPRSERAPRAWTYPRQKIESAPPCVEGRRSTHRLAASNAHRRAARGWRPRLAGPPLTAPRPEVDGGEWRVASRADLCAEMPRGPHVGTEVCAEMPRGSHVGSEVPVGRPHDRSVFQLL